MFSRSFMGGGLMCPALRRRSLFTGIPSHCGRCRSEGPPAAGRTASALGAPFRLGGLSLALSRLSPFCQIGEESSYTGRGLSDVVAALDLPERFRVVWRWRRSLPDQKFRSPVPTVFSSATDDSQTKCRVREVAPLAAVSRQKRSD